MFITSGEKASFRAWLPSRCSSERKRERIAESESAPRRVAAHVWRRWRGILVSSFLVEDTYYLYLLCILPHPTF